MGTILVVEDDYLTSESLETLIERELADLRPEIELVETESDFTLKWLPEFEQGKRQRPDAIVLDVMLRWTDPDPDQPAPPPEVIEGGFDKAGIRCYKLIRSKPSLAECPVILLTNLSEEDLDSRGGKPSGVLFVPKGEEPNIINPLREALEQSSKLQ